jgi:hypothetical protein
VTSVSSLWLINTLGDDVDEGVATTSRGQNQQHTLTSGKRSPEMRSAVTRDIKEVLKKSFVVSTQQAATEMASRTGSPGSKKLNNEQYSGREHEQVSQKHSKRGKLA